jgi:uncharacterized membrane protein
LDFIWLGVVAKNFYAEQLGDLMADNIRFSIAAAFYLTYTVGIVVFAVRPVINGDAMIMALVYGGLFGFLAYGTYDFTNMATLKNWPVPMSIVDLAWGTSVTAITSFATAYTLRFFNLI